MSSRNCFFSARRFVAKNSTLSSEPFWSDVTKTFSMSRCTDVVLYRRIEPPYNGAMNVHYECVSFSFHTDANRRRPTVIRVPTQLLGDMILYSLCKILYNTFLTFWWQSIYCTCYVCVMVSGRHLCRYQNWYYYHL